MSYHISFKKKLKNDFNKMKKQQPTTLSPSTNNHFKKSLSIIISKFKTNKSFRFTFYFILFLFIFINTIIFSYFSYRHYYYLKYYLKYKEKLKYEEYVNNCLNYKLPSTFLSLTLSINGKMEEKLIKMNENDNKEIELIPTSVHSINDNSINGNNNEIIVNNNEVFTITNEQINKFQKDQCNAMCHIYLPPIQPLQKKITLQNSLQNTLQNTLQDSINNELTIIDLSEINKWHNNFIPNIEDIKIETDLQQWINTNLEEWNNFCNFPQDNINLDYLKIKMNKLGFTINGNLQNNNHHIPIWLRVYKRIHPLQQTLQKLCQVDDINTTILYITIDGNENLKEIINLLITIKCVKIKVYFHTYFYNSSDKLFNLEKKGYSIARKLNTHYIFGMYLILHIWKYNYIITLEDDLEPTPDFYRYHFSLYQFIYNNHLNKESNLIKKIFSITSHSHGKVHDCHFIKTKLEGKGNCLINNVNFLIKEEYFVGWGSALTKEIFNEYLSIWTNYIHRVYDRVLWQLRSYNNRIVIVPCSPRTRLIPNKGTHGNTNGNWDSYLLFVAKWKTLPEKRVYRFIN